MLKQRFSNLKSSLSCCQGELIQIFHFEVWLKQIYVHVIQIFLTAIVNLYVPSVSSLPDPNDNILADCRHYVPVL